MGLKRDSVETLNHTGAKGCDKLQLYRAQRGNSHFHDRALERKFKCPAYFESTG